MNFKKLKELVNNLETYSCFNASDDSLYINEILKFVVEESKDENIILNMILTFQRLKDENYRKKNQTLYLGLEHSFMNWMHYVDEIEQNEKVPKKIKDISNFHFNNKEGNIAWLITIAKAYFPLGHAEGHTEYGKIFFNKFKTFLMKNKDKYLTGKSKDWAEMFDHYNYIKLVIELEEKENE